MTASPVSRPYDVALLVYNPHSTGGAEGRAHELRRDLAERAPWLEVRLVPTEYAGHARQIAANAARTLHALVVSVSGDGGYNEVVTGAMDAGGDAATRAVVAVAPAGNANDHRRATARGPVADAVAAARVERLDLLRVCVGDERPRYAHSYVGLGITPVVALDLEAGGKGSLREVAATVRGFARFHPFEIVLESGERSRFDSLVLTTTGSMAKYVTLDADADPTDGLLEVVTIPHRSKFRLLATAVRAATRGLDAQRSVRRFGFTTTGPTPMQLDGEVVELDGDRRVVVEVAAGALATVR